MSSTRDSYFYEEYNLASYEEEEGPPLIHKRSRLLAAVVQNQVGVLQDLLDSPEWYNVTDKYGLTLLQVAILTDNKEVFNYMLSLPDFPIDFVNEDGQTALHSALDGFVSNDIWMSQHFASELVKKGASTDIICFEGNPPLSRALVRSYNKVAILLIQKGVDVNAPDYQGYTPLESALDMYKGVDEVVPALLIYGATPTVCAFEMSFTHNTPCFIQEMLFLYIFDQYSDVDLRLLVILKIAESKSVLFHELLNHKFTVNIDGYYFEYLNLLIEMDIDFLRIFIDKFSSEISQAFAEVGFNSLLHLQNLNSVTCLENLEFMLGSDLRSDVISIVSAVDGEENLSSDVICTWTEIYCYLLSYGLTISDYQLLEIYAKNGHCELFKILLHMDINFIETEKPLWPTILYDVALNIEHFFKHPDQYTWNSDTIKKLCKYFAHPRLIELYAESIGDSSQILEIPPKVPHLTELARNVFRKYFIETFQIQTSRRFYTLLNSLLISTVHKKIISYEIELYGIF